MNYFAVKKRVQKVPKGKSRGISFDRLLKIESNFLIKALLKLTAVSFNGEKYQYLITVSNANILHITFTKKSVQEPFLLVLFIEYCLYCVRIIWRYVAASSEKSIKKLLPIR